MSDEKCKFCFANGSALILLLLTLCFGLEAEAAKVKVGILWPMSGPVAVTGEEVRKGFVVAAEEINKAGGIKSLGGAELEFVYADTQGKLEVGLSEARRLIHRDNVVAMIGAWQSAVTVPVTQISEQARVPHLVTLAAADVITARGFKYVFRLAAPTGSYATTIFAFLKDMQNSSSPKGTISRLALLYENTDFGSSTAAGVKKTAPTEGFNIVNDSPYPHTTSDLAATISRIKADRPDVIVATSYGPDAILIMRTMHELKVSPPAGLIGTVAGYVDPKFIKTLGNKAENVLALSYWNSDLRKPEAQAFLRKFVEKYKEEPIGLAAYTYSAAHVMKAALERAGKADREAVRKALSEIDITSGPAMAIPPRRIKFGSSGQSVDGQTIVLQIQRGKFVTIWPAQYSSGKAVWPPILFPE